MKQEDLLASEVHLAGPIAAVDRQGKQETLFSVGEAARFLLANFKSGHGSDVDWRAAAGALEQAAETDSGYDIVYATKAITTLLESEGLTPPLNHSTLSDAGTRRASSPVLKVGA